MTLSGLLKDSENQTQKDTDTLQPLHVSCACAFHWEGLPGPPAPGLCELGHHPLLPAHSSLGINELTSAWRFSFFFSPSTRERGADLVETSVC